MENVKNIKNWETIGNAIINFNRRVSNSTKFANEIMEDVANNPDVTAEDFNSAIDQAHKMSTEAVEAEKAIRILDDFQKNLYHNGNEILGDSGVMMGYMRRINLIEDPRIREAVLMIVTKTMTSN